VYQCFAVNGVGKAMSNTTQVVKAERAQFPEVAVRSEPVTVGRRLRINCQPTLHGVPTPTVEQLAWRRDYDDHQWSLDQRVQIDDSGMHILHHGGFIHEPGRIIARIISIRSLPLQTTASTGLIGTWVFMLCRWSSLLECSTGLSEVTRPFI